MWGYLEGVGDAGVILVIASRAVPVLPAALVRGGGGDGLGPVGLLTLVETEGQLLAQSVEGHPLFGLPQVRELGAHLLTDPGEVHRLLVVGEADEASVVDLGLLLVGQAHLLAAHPIAHHVVLDGVREQDLLGRDGHHARPLGEPGLSGHAHHLLGRDGEALRRERPGHQQQGRDGRGRDGQGLAASGRPRGWRLRGMEAHPGPTVTLGRYRPLGQFCLGKAMGVGKTAVSHPRRQISILANSKHVSSCFEYESLVSREAYSQNLTARNFDIYRHH